MQTIAFLGIAVGFLGSPQGDPFVHEPTSSYETKMYHGFTVRISRAARVKAHELYTALGLLKTKLKEITEIVPPEPLSVLKKIPIWVEWNNPNVACCCYHPDKRWLEQNGYNVDKENSVEMGNPVNFVKWTTEDQPMMVLHELAHGYHDIVFGYDDKYIESCYRNAMTHGLYQSVPFHRGQQKSQAYATKNAMEYFAELTEAYFGKNDWYPFTREELKEYDPKGFEMMQRIWGEPLKRASQSTGAYLDGGQSSVVR